MCVTFQFQHPGDWEQEMYRGGAASTWLDRLAGLNPLDDLLEIRLEDDVDEDDEEADDDDDEAGGLLAATRREFDFSTGGCSSYGQVLRSNAQENKQIAEIKTDETNKRNYHSARLLLTSIFLK